MIELKHFAFQVEQLRTAMLRYDELIAQAEQFKTPVDLKAAEQMVEMIRQLGIAVDQSLVLISKQPRIAPEQIEADVKFSSALEASLDGWKKELEKLQVQIMEQAIIDSKAGEKSQLYTDLEKNESDLKTSIASAEQKLGKVSERVTSPAFSNQVNQIVNRMKS
jgi:hypothetical protein